MTRSSRKGKGKGKGGERVKGKGEILKFLASHAQIHWELRNSKGSKKFNRAASYSQIWIPEIPEIDRADN